MSYLYGDNIEPSTEQSLDWLKGKVAEKDEAFAKYQKLYPYIKKAIQKYGSQMYGFSWDSKPAFKFQKYSRRTPQGFLSYLESMGLIVEEVQQDSLGFLRVEISGVENVRNVS